MGKRIWPVTLIAVARPFLGKEEAQDARLFANWHCVEA
jgi:hypothetical protein